MVINHYQIAICQPNEIFLLNTEIWITGNLLFAHEFDFQLIKLMSEHYGGMLQLQNSIYFLIVSL